MTHAVPPQMTPVSERPVPVASVPTHLVGTRAALFFLWHREAVHPLPAEGAAPRPASPLSGLDRVRAALQSDVFVFGRGA